MKSEGSFSLPWIFLGAAAIVAALVVNTCQEDECRGRGGRVVSGWSNGHYVSLCMEPVEK